LNRTIAARWRAGLRNHCSAIGLFACPRASAAVAVRAPLMGRPALVASTTYNHSPPTMIDASRRRLMALQRGSKISRRIAGAEDTMRNRSEETMLMIGRCAPALTIAVGLIFALETVPAARAQVTIDVSKITCNQFVDREVGDPRDRNCAQ
jgi:hypothetical protein